MNFSNRAIFSILDRSVFQPMYEVGGYLNSCYSVPAIAVKADDNFLKRAVAPIANGLKVSVLAVAFAVGELGAFIFSVLSWPIRAYQLSKVREQALKDDLNRLTPQEHDLLNQDIKAFIEKKSKVGLTIDPNELDTCIEQVKAYYARSRDIYGAVAVKWAEYLLNKANANGQKLVFMARDGAAPYKLAQNMMKEEAYQQAYPGMAQEGRIVMGYFSRKVVGNSYETPEGQKLFKEYLVNELGIKPGDNCLFVDVGFEGSMIDKIREMASDLTGVQASAEEFKPVASPLNQSRVKAKIPNHAHAKASQMSFWDKVSNLFSPPKVEAPKKGEVPLNPAKAKAGLEKKKVTVKFEYLISLTPKATGFLGTNDEKLASVPWAGGGNYGVHWLEDSHQGVISSPTHLVKHSDGHIYANTAIPGQEQTCIHSAKDYVLRKFSKKAVTDAYKTTDPTADLKVLKSDFDNTLDRILRCELPLLISHA